MFFAVDDASPFHRKVISAGNEAWGAFCRAGAWSCAPANLTDGWIPADVCAAIAPAEVWAKLRRVGLLEDPAEGRDGVQIHDFHTYNLPAEKVKAKREADRDRLKRWRNGERNGVSQPVSSGVSNAVTNAVRTRVPVPVPVPDPDHTCFAGAHEEQATGQAEEPPTPSTARSAARPEAPHVTGLGARNDSPSSRSGPSTSPPPLLEQRPLAELGPDDSRVGELADLARALAAEGNRLGESCVDRLERLLPMSPGQLATLRKIRDERVSAAPRGGQGQPVSAEAQGVLEAYAAGRARAKLAEVAPIDADRRAACKIAEAAQAAAALPGSKGRTAAAIAAHWIAQYLRLTDRAAVEQGYPLALLLSRVDRADLPAVARQGAKDAPDDLEWTRRAHERDKARRGPARGQGGAASPGGLGGGFAAAVPGLAKHLAAEQEAAEIAAARAELLAKPVPAMGER